MDESKQEILEKFQQTQDPKHLFKVEDICGKGTYGTVYKCIDNLTGEPVALKIMDIVQLENNNEELEDIQNEVNLLAKIKNQYVARYFGSYIRSSQLWIAMEYLGGGSLNDLMKAGLFDEKYIRVILRDVVRGLSYLHEKKIIHRDVKSSNIMLSESGEVKLVDFGVAAQLNPGQVGRDTICGTPSLMAPEIIISALYDSKVDIWSVGIVGIELARGFPPNHNVPAMRAMLLTKELEPPQLTEDHFSKEYKNFVSACLKKDPTKRPTSESLLSHPFITVDTDSSILIDLIKKYEQWRGPKSKGKQAREILIEKNLRQSINEDDDFWSFDGSSERIQMESQKKDSQLFDLLNEHNVSTAYDHLIQNDIEFATFHLLKEQDLEKMDLSIGIRKKLLILIEQINEELMKKKSSDNLQAISDSKSKEESEKESSSEEEESSEESGSESDDKSSSSDSSISTKSQTEESEESQSFEAVNKVVDDEKEAEQEKERIKREIEEKERKEKEEKEREEKERQEKEEKERQEREEKERQEKERQEKEAKEEQERKEKERQENEGKERQRIEEMEKQKLENERLEREKQEKEREELERLAKEKEKEEMEKKKIEQEEEKLKDEEPKSETPKKREVPKISIPGDFSEDDSPPTSPTKPTPTPTIQKYENEKKTPTGALPGSIVRRQEVLQTRISNLLDELMQKTENQDIFEFTDFFDPADMPASPKTPYSQMSVSSQDSSIHTSPSPQTSKSSNKISSLFKK